MKNVLHTREHVYAKNVREHRQTYQKGVVRDFIDAYLTAMYQEEEEGRDTNLCGEYQHMALVWVSTGH